MGVSGYKVVTQILFLRKNERDCHPVANVFQNSPGGFIYPGIKITPDIKDLVPENYNFILTSVSESRKRRSDLPISLIRRVSIVKMNILSNLKNTIKVWYKMKAHLNIMSDVSGFTPIWSNHRFSPGRDDPVFKLWAERGISKVMDMYNNNNILYSFADLQRTYNIPIPTSF